MLTIGSLFSGIGGLELGLEWAGLGPTLWQVERDAFCLRKLAWRWPDAARFDDVRSVGAANLPPVDLICGGFPCQDVSSAGKRAGLAGARSGLWYEFARVVAELRPRWVVVENVSSGARKWVDPVRGELGQFGYASLPVPIAASDCGAPHERARVFIVARHPAHAERPVLRLEHGRRSGAYGQCAPEFDHHRGWTVEPAVARVVHGLPGRVDYERALGNSVVPQCAEVVGHVIRKLVSTSPRNLSRVKHALRGTELWSEW